METAPRSVWKKVLWIGCGLALAFGAVVTLVVVLNWSKITGFVSETADTIAAMSEVQNAVRETFHAPETFAKSKYTTGVAGRILSVEVVNAPFFSQLMIDGEEGRAMAFDIACTARAALPQGTHYENFEVIFNRRTKVGAVLSRTRVTKFAESDLDFAPRFLRSGTAENDDAEEPLRTEAETYARALSSSNEFVESLRARDYGAIYARCGEDVRGNTDAQTLANTMGEAVDKFGAIRGYKPGQWKFAVREYRSRRILASTKIVEHERAVINYTFQFEEGGGYETLVGCQWYTRSIAAPEKSPK
ncbi:MAG: hypothetical protein JNL28_12265 [Planctomycetes bacterium]|nr:hypothetical protein [Planctomycetota bacterium]